MLTNNRVIAPQEKAIKEEVSSSDSYIIYRASRRKKDGTIEYARDYGLKGFPIRIHN